jgi:hypothetical protein
MKFATRFEVLEGEYGRSFRFLDRTGMLHGEFRENDPVSPAPAKVVGITKFDGWWFWVTRDTPSFLTASTPVEKKA